jgi:hypothetical protein
VSSDLLPQLPELARASVRAAEAGGLGRLPFDAQGNFESQSDTVFRHIVPARLPATRRRRRQLEGEHSSPEFATL